MTTPPVAEWHQVVTWVARTHRMGLGMPPREPGSESHRPEEEAVMAVELYPPPTGGAVISCGGQERIRGEHPMRERPRHDVMIPTRQEL